MDREAPTRSGLRIADVVIDCREHDPLLAFWEQALGYQRGFRSEQYAELRPPAPSGLSILFQKVPEPKIVKNRVHLDLRASDMAAEVARLEGIGATRLREASLGSFRWTVLIDPEGNEFCVGQE